ncbi:MarR family winged helix-turn-helix transcriptional regulator [Nocardioides pyridinolyticus]
MVGVVARTGGSRVVDLAGIMSVNPSTVSRICERLLRKGMVSRTSQECDRRAVRLTLTETARAIVDEATGARTVEIEAIVARVSPAQRAVLVAGFQAFAHAAGEVGDDLWPAATLGWLSTSAESPGD